MTSISKAADALYIEAAQKALERAGVRADEADALVTFLNDGNRNAEPRSASYQTNGISFR